MLKNRIAGLARLISLEANIDVETGRFQQFHVAQHSVSRARDAFIAMNAEGRITEWNQQAERIFGWSGEEAIGRLVAETVIPPTSPLWQVVIIVTPLAQRRSAPLKSSGSSAIRGG